MLYDLARKLNKLIGRKGLAGKIFYAFSASAVLMVFLFFLAPSAESFKGEPAKLAAGFFSDARAIFKNIADRIMPDANNIELAQIDGEAIRRKNSGGAEEELSDLDSSA